MFPEQYAEVIYKTSKTDPVTQYSKYIEDPELRKCGKRSEQKQAALPMQSHAAPEPHLKTATQSKDRRLLLLASSPDLL